MIQDFFPRIKPFLLHILLIGVVTSWAREAHWASVAMQCEDGGACTRKVMMRTAEAPRNATGPTFADQYEHMSFLTSSTCKERS
jgi:hypothetical protein